MDERLYTSREVAQNTKWNPKGMGLLPFDYIYVTQRIDQKRLGFSDLTITPGGHKKYKFSREDINNYLREYCK